MPRHSENETLSSAPATRWSAFLAAAVNASLPALPQFADLLGRPRDHLFQELGYSFWNRELVEALAGRMHSETCRRWLELAAGTGRLTAELARRGVNVVATDDYSQAPEAVRDSQRPIAYGSWVARLSARDAMMEFAPEGAICAWPPLGSCLIPDLLSGSVRGSGHLRLVLAVGDPQGATEAPLYPHELPEGWSLEEWPESARWLTGFNDPDDAPGRNSRLLVYRKNEARREK